MPKKEGRIIATGINPQGVPWKEISFVEEKKEKLEKQKGKQKENKDNDSIRSRQIS